MDTLGLIKPLRPYGEVYANCEDPDGNRGRMEIHFYGLV